MNRKSVERETGRGGGRRKDCNRWDKDGNEKKERQDKGLLLLYEAEPMRPTGNRKRNVD